MGRGRDSGQYLKAGLLEDSREKLSLLRHGLEGGWLGFRGNRADLRFGNVVADGALIRKSAEPAPTADRPREHGDSSDNVKPA